MAHSGNGSATRDDLDRQIAALKEDVAGISRVLSQMAAERGDEMQGGMRDAAAELRAHGQALGDQASDAIRRQPATAVGLAVGAGFLLGLLTGRR